VTDEPRRTRKQFVAAFTPHGLVHLLDRFAFRLRRARVRLTLRIFALLGVNVRP